MLYRMRSSEVHSRLSALLCALLLSAAALLSCRGAAPLPDAETDTETESETTIEETTHETEPAAEKTLPADDTLGYTVTLLPPFDTDTDAAPRDPSDTDTIVSLYHAATREGAFDSAGFLFSIVRETEPQPDLTGSVTYFARDDAYYYAVLTPTDVRVDPANEEISAYTERAQAKATFLDRFIADNGLTPYSFDADREANTAKIPDRTEDGHALRFIAAYGTGSVAVPEHRNGCFAVPPTEQPMTREYVFAVLGDDGTPGGEYVTYLVQTDYGTLAQCGTVATKTAYVMRNYGKPHADTLAGFQSTSYGYDPETDRTYRYSVGVAELGYWRDKTNAGDPAKCAPGGITVIRECVEDGERVVYYGDYDYNGNTGAFLADLTPYTENGAGLTKAGETKRVSGTVYAYEGQYAFLMEDTELPLVFMPYAGTDFSLIYSSYLRENTISADNFAFAAECVLPYDGRNSVYTGYAVRTAVRPTFSKDSDGYTEIFENHIVLPQLGYDTASAKAWNEEIRDTYFERYGSHFLEAAKTGYDDFAVFIDYDVYRTNVSADGAAATIETIVVRNTGSLIGTCGAWDERAIYHYDVNSDTFLTDAEFLEKTVSVYGDLTIETLADRANRHSFAKSPYGETRTIAPRDILGVVPSRAVQGKLDLCYRNASGTEWVLADEYPVWQTNDGHALTYCLYYDAPTHRYRFRTTREVSYGSEPFVYSLDSVTCDTRTGTYLTTETGLTVTGKTSFGDTLFLPYAKDPDLQTILRWYSDQYYTADALFAEELVQTYAQNRVRELLQAYREQGDVINMLPAADPATPAVFPEGETVPDVDTIWFSDCYRPGAYRGLGIGYLRVPLESGASLVFPLSVGGFGDAFDLYPDGIFYESVRTPDGEDVIARGYDTEMKMEIVLSEKAAYVAENGGELRRIDVELPTGYENVRFTGTDGTHIVLAGEEKSGETRILTMDLSGSFAEVVDAEQILALYLAGCELPFPNVVLPQSVAADFSLANRYGSASVYDASGSRTSAAPFADETELCAVFGKEAAENPVIRYGAALLNRDVTAVEAGAGTEGLYGGLYGVTFDRAVLYTVSDAAENAWIALPEYLRICYTISDSPFAPETALGVGTHYGYIEDGMNGLTLCEAEAAENRTEAEETVRRWLALSYAAELPTSDAMSDEARMDTTDFICMQLSDAAGRPSHTAAEVAAYAKSHLGIDGFTPDPSRQDEDGGYTLPGRCGASHNYRFLTERESDGIHEVTVRFYTDGARLIEAETYVYSLKKQPDGTWAFVGCS